MYSINKEILPRLIFPLADFEDKEQIREIARENKLRVANKPDSEDICFIPDGDYKRFLEENSDLSPKPGNIVDKQGNVLGKHNGLYKYTIDDLSNYINKLAIIDRNFKSGKDNVDRFELFLFAKDN